MLAYVYVVRVCRVFTAGLTAPFAFFARDVAPLAAPTPLEIVQIHNQLVIATGKST